MLLVQIKGSNGSGKTTIVKQLLKLDECEYLKNEAGKVYATLDVEAGWAAVGRYDALKPMGGCDVLNTIDEIKEAIEATITQCLYSDWEMTGVIFEGMMISTIKSTFYDFLQLMEDEYDVEPLMVILNATGSGCIERIYQRRYKQGARRKRLNVDHVIAKCNLVIRHAKTYDPQYVRWIDIEATPLERMADKFLEAVTLPHYQPQHEQTHDMEGVRTTELMGLNTYISKLRSALRSPGAHSLYFPPNKAERKRANLRFAREMGFGLKDYPPEDVRRIIGTLYGKLIVANSLDSTGVAIDAGPWNREILRRAGVKF